jgi:hypothetical protein
MLQFMNLTSPPTLTFERMSLFNRSVIKIVLFSIETYLFDSLVSSVTDDEFLWRCLNDVFLSNDMIILQELDHHR